MIPFNRFSFKNFVTGLLAGWQSQQKQQLDRIEQHLIHMAKELDDLQAAATAAESKLESIAQNVLDLRAQITVLQNSTVDPAAVESVAQQLSATLADVESKLGTPAKTS